MANIEYVDLKTGVVYKSKQDYDAKIKAAKEDYKIESAGRITLSKKDKEATIAQEQKLASDLRAAQAKIAELTKVDEGVSSDNVLDKIDEARLKDRAAKQRAKFDKLTKPIK